MRHSFSTLARRLLVTSLVGLGLFAPPAYAHDPGLSSLTLRLHRNRVDAVLRLSAQDAATLGCGSEGESRAAEEILRLWTDGVERAPTRVGGRRVSTTHVECDFEFPDPPRSSLRALFAAHSRLAYGHKQLVRLVSDRGDVLATSVRSADDPPFVQRFDHPPRFPGVSAYVLVGIEHILLGADHLLFLFSLLLSCFDFRSVLRTITGFTVAHSITLAAATLGWVVVPASIVEPAIAASIVWVALRNLGGGPQARERLGLCFGFGLVHGFGFAGALVDLGVGQRVGILAPLLGFNLGVELGQLAVVGTVLPVLRRVAASRCLSWASPQLASLAVATLGLWWLVVRVGVV